MWLRDTTVEQRRVLAASYAGYGLDGFDFMVYSFVIPTLLTLWQMSKVQAGYIASTALVASAVGGWGAGVLADRYGRARILQLTVVWFSVFTFLSGFTHSFGGLCLTRALQGVGFGGEWAVGSILVAEAIHPRHRGRAAGLIQSSWSIGWACAALACWAASAYLPLDVGWRVVFWLGLLPALLVIYIRRNVHDSPSYTTSAARPKENFTAIFGAHLRVRTALATVLCTGMLAAYYSITTWLPTFLATERHLSVAGTTAYLLTVITGSLFGYLCSGWLADVIGRRLCFIVFAICGAALIVCYTRMPVGGSGMALIGLPLGFFVLGIFSGTGAFLSELFPSNVRGSGQGFTYSVGRGIGGFCPLFIGYLSAHVTLADSIAVFTVIAYGIVVIAACILPETRGRVLDTAADAAAG